MDKEYLKKIKEEIARTGIPLELELVEKLRTNPGTLVLPNLTFQNEEKSIRELDIVAIFQQEDAEWDKGPVGIQLLVECKKTDKNPWVFFEEMFDPLTGLGLVGRLDHSTDQKVQNGNLLVGCQNTSLGDHHYNDHALPISKTYFEAHKKPNEPTAIFKSVMNIFHGRKFLKEWFDTSSKKHIGQNLPRRSYLSQYSIVLDGPLILASKTATDFDVKEVDHILLRTINTLTAPKNDLLGDEIIIDIITKSYFDEYIDITNENLTKFTRHLKSLLDSGLVTIINNGVADNLPNTI